MTDDPDDHVDALARLLGSGEWAKLRAQVLEASVFQTIGWPLVKIGRFDALVCIGEGGFGTVFKARDPKLGRLVALKLCRTRSKDVVDGIMNEAMALAQLEHANIVTIFELGEHDGAVFFAMRYLAGKNAERFAERDPRPTCNEVLKVYRYVARGLAAAHARKYVHGDIKPSNVLLDADDVGYIADFGLARRMMEDADESEREELRRRGGTMYYMAPEVLAGGRGDARSDQFSFFVALYQTLTAGKLPFYGKSSGEVLEAIEHTDIRDLIDPSWPVALQVVMRIGLSLVPDERFPDMATVEAEINRLLQMPPPSSPPRDEPEFDEPEFDESEPDESDGPERMHEPERADEIALMVGEPEVMGGEPPSHEPEAIVGELPPVGGDPEPRKAKRGTFVASLVLVGAVGLTLGWAGRGRVGVEPARVSEPTPAPAPSPCAMVASDPTVGSKSALIPTCSRIRAGELLAATRLWDVEFDDRRLPDPGEPAPTSSELAQLRAETLMVARTFVDQAERMSRWAWVAQSIQGTATELGWRMPDDPIVTATDTAEEWVVRLEQLKIEGLDPEDPDLRSIRDRVDRLRGSVRPSED